eukprot:jgi/Botrbrau1/11169/Bobra.182_2s0024.2
MLTRRFYKKSSGIGVNSKVAWLIQETPSFLVPVVLLASTSPAQRSGMKPDQAMLLAMFLLHYTWRSFAYPLLIRGGKPTALLPWLLAVLFCTVNGFIQGASLIYMWPPNRPSWGLPWLLGATLWGLGWAANLHADHLLRSLRKPGETGYKIPRGGLFEFVSGANYFAETVEWLGFAIACRSLPATAFAAFTVSNVGPRAVQHHKWYKATFGSSYPAHRTAFVPYVW